MLKKSIAVKQEENKRLEGAIALRGHNNASWPNSWPNNILVANRKVGTEETTNPAEKKSQEKKPASMASSEDFCPNQEAQRQKEEEKRLKRRCSVTAAPHQCQEVEPALPLGTPPRRIIEESTDGSAYDSPNTYKERTYRRRLEEKKKRMQMNMQQNK